MSDYDLKTVLPKILQSRFNFALYKGKKDNQVIISKQPPTPKLIAEVDAEIGGGSRIAKGVCFFENAQFIFATKAEPTPAWEQITAKILKEHQCAKYLPVIFRRLAENESDVADAEVPVSDPPPPTEPTAVTPPAPLSPEDAARLKQAAVALAPRLKAAIAAHPEQKAALAQAFSAVSVALNGNDGNAVKQALAALLRQLKPLESSTPLPGNGEKPPENLVVFTQSRLRWDQARKKVQAELRRLEESILSTSRDEIDFDEIQSGTGNLYGMLEELDDRLEDTLDAALNAETPEKRQTLHGEASTIVSEYLAYVNGDALIQDIDDNGFIKVAIRSTLTETLADLQKKLSASIG